MRLPIALLCAPLAIPLSAGAAPPPGHPSPEQAARMLNLPGGDVPLPHAGEVLGAIASNRYTFVRVTDGEGARWLAVPRQTLAPGARIRYGDGRLLRNFRSRKLEATFDEILFVNAVAVVAQRP